jgi:hypothetical protein
VNEFRPLEGKHESSLALPPGGSSVPVSCPIGPEWVGYPAKSAVDRRDQPSEELANPIAGCFHNGKAHVGSQKT